MVQQISSSGLPEILAQNKVVVADFYAVWCGPCKMMHPILEELSNKYKNVKFVKIDIDQNTDFAIKQNVQVVPTFIGYNNGVEVNRVLGFLNKEDFDLFVQSLQ